jgi:hypothetical protein
VYSHNRARSVNVNEPSRMARSRSLRGHTPFQCMLFFRKDHRGRICSRLTPHCHKYDRLSDTGVDRSRRRPISETALRAPTSYVSSLCGTTGRPNKMDSSGTVIHEKLSRKSRGVYSAPPANARGLLTPFLTSLRTHATAPSQRTHNAHWVSSSVFVLPFVLEYL